MRRAWRSPPADRVGDHVTRIGADLLETLTAMFNPLPSIALLPLALIWFGLGTGSVIFVLIHAVLWSVALNDARGFMAVSRHAAHGGAQLRALAASAYMARILVPAAFPSILTGLKVGWAFAWRTLIAAELVFGVAPERRARLVHLREQERARNPQVFAGLLTVILFGLAVENIVFRSLENRTVRRWGCRHSDRPNRSERPPMTSRVSRRQVLPIELGRSGSSKSQSLDALTISAPPRPGRRRVDLGNLAPTRVDRPASIAKLGGRGRLRRKSGLSGRESRLTRLCHRSIGERANVS